MNELKILEYKFDQMKNLFITSIILGAGTAYASFLLAQQVNKIYYYGFIISGFFAFCAFFTKMKSNKYKAMLTLKDQWGKADNRKRKFESIKSLFLFLKQEEKERFFIDDQTWEDLNMDKVFAELDRTLSTPGEQALYALLRKPLLNKEPLSKRGEIITLLQEDKTLREKLELQLFKLGKQFKGNTSELLWDELPATGNYRVLFNVLALMPIILAILYPFIKGTVVMLILVSFGVNLYIHYKFGNRISSYVLSIKYLGAIVNTAKSIGNMENHILMEYNDILKKNAAICSKLSKKTNDVGSIEGIDMFADYINILFLTKERGFYSSINEIKAHRKELREIYVSIGELDALISAASFRSGLSSYVEPELENNGRYMIIENMTHPLIKDAVPNSIGIDEKGIVLTGSNMSGKSTFLRTIGINALLAQTINTSLASSYKASFFKIITSISPSDNLLTGKSYYLGEAEALLRIIKSCEETIPSLCVIDEIFRGTNPIERISASAEILEYLIEHNSLVFVATHDLELTELVQNYYECYYFTEDVSEEGLKFDYQIRKGVSPTRNAIKLLKYLGYPEEIVEKTNERVDKINK